ncbi:response regulator [Halarsenatibacter silvermanii]|uniref:Stage 0 sporulation protein A homolog n=1 Tax=Halarsenatibacter silvermanii TaxID=321763 RepID=A0A1G9RNW1_9FIRM|nr:response regulator [Halarsenatibacter silvermanii]SDM24657.1 PAS domain S-box-containing protein [Halarsenatibacter silvermanii]
MNDNKFILIVDDNSQNLRLLSQILKKDGYKIVMANEGETGIDIAISKEIDLILLDIMMPGMDGFEVCRRLKAHRETRNIPVIFISARQEIEDKIKAFEVGGVDYITKPFNKKKVLARTKTHLNLEEINNKLKRESDKQNILLDNIESQVWYLEDEKTYGMVNQEFADFVGLARSEIENKTIREIREEKEIASCIAGNQEVFQNKEKIAKEEWVENSSGEKRLLEITKTPKLNEDKEVEYVVCTAFDITERKKQERIIKELHEVAVDLKILEQEEEICQRTIEAANEIFNFDLCHISLVKDNEFMPVAYSEGMEAETLPLDYGIIRKSYKLDECYLTSNLTEDLDAAPTTAAFKSVITIPLKEIGVFQALATKNNFFSQRDVELAEILISHTRAALKNIYSQAELEEKHENLKRVKGLLDEEIQKAKRLHEKTLPTNIPGIAGLDMYAHYEPAYKIGGDFYNFIKLADDKLLFYLTDISGHGFDSSLMACFVKNIINTYIELQPDEDSLNPKKIVEFIFKQNQQENFPEEYFITIILGVIDMTKNELTYSNAGLHIPPVLCTDNGQSLEELPIGGFPISKSIPIEVIEYENTVVDLIEEDLTLFVSTDGLYEQTNGQIQYEDRYKKIISRHSSFTPKKLAEKIQEDFASFHQDDYTEDDVTFAIFQLKR